MNLHLDVFNPGGSVPGPVFSVCFCSCPHVILDKDFILERTLELCKRLYSTIRDLWRCLEGCCERLLSMLREGADSLQQQSVFIRRVLLATSCRHLWRQLHCCFMYAIVKEALGFHDLFESACEGQQYTFLHLVGARRCWKIWKRESRHATKQQCIVTKWL